ncbi:hypothetical protein M3J07_005774 [Ascochyta lentis]
MRLGNLFWAVPHPRLSATRSLTAHVLIQSGGLAINDCQDRRHGICSSMRLMIRLFLSKITGLVACPCLSVGPSIFVLRDLDVYKHPPTARVWKARDLRERIPMDRPTLLGACLSRRYFGGPTHGNMNIYVAFSEGCNSTLSFNFFIDLWCRALSILLPYFLFES